MKNRKIIIVLSVFILLSSCISMNIPKEYVPDKEIVYLRQKTELRPIRYDIKITKPYEWHPDAVVDTVNPAILKITDFEFYKKPDMNNDVKAYKEIKEHLLYMSVSGKFFELKEILDKHDFIMPEERKIAKGDKIEDFTNVSVYSYPEIPGAKIYFFSNGGIKIDLPDGGSYSKQSDGSYFETDADKKDKFAVFPKSNSFRYVDDGISYEKRENYISIETADHYIAHFEEPIEQYVYKNKESQFKYFFFLGDKKAGSYIEYSLIYNDKLRFDFLPEKDIVMITLNDQALIIDKYYKKALYFFDNKTNKTDYLLSFYLPEGIRINDINKSLTYSTLSPNWPEKYLSSRIGQFVYYYTEKDKNLISKINVSKINEISGFVKKTAGIDFMPGRSVIIPPDLVSYTKLFIGDGNNEMNWYPSGFETSDTIVMWPLSVKVYDSPDGDDYFWNEEVNSILTHELTHLAVGEITGIYSPVPVWLNEGLAVYTESAWSPEIESYWTITFDASYKLGKLLDWDDIAVKATSEFDLAKARVHYAQSYKMVRYLISTYGVKSVVNYIRSFKSKIGDNELPEVPDIYKENFKMTFKIVWEDNLKSFEEYVKKNLVK